MLHRSAYVRASPGWVSHSAGMGVAGLAYGVGVILLRYRGDSSLCPHVLAHPIDIELGGATCIPALAG